MPEAAGARRGAWVGTGQAHLVQASAGTLGAGPPPVGVALGDALLAQWPAIAVAAYTSARAPLGSLSWAGAECQAALAGPGRTAVAGRLCASPTQQHVGLTDLLGKRGSSAVAGALGRGRCRLDRIAQAIGAALGSILGALMWWAARRGQVAPSYRTTGLAAPPVSFVPGMGVTIPQAFDVPGAGQRASEVQLQEDRAR